MVWFKQVVKWTDFSKSENKAFNKEVFIQVTAKFIEAYDHILTTNVHIYIISYPGSCVLETVINLFFILDTK